MCRSVPPQYKPKEPAQGSFFAKANVLTKKNKNVIIYYKNKGAA